MITLLDRAGLDALQVAAGSRFGHRDRGDQFAGAELGQPALLLLFGGQAQQVGRHDVVVQAEADPAVAPGGGFLGDDRVVPEVGVAAAAVLLGHRHAQEALLAGLQPHAAVDDLRLLPFVVMGRDVAIEEGPVGLAEQLMLGLEKSALVLDGGCSWMTSGGEWELCRPTYTNRVVGRWRAGSGSRRGGLSAPLARHSNHAHDTPMRICVVAVSAHVSARRIPAGWRPAPPAPAP